jgi:hypothetical protein
MATSINKIKFEEPYTTSGYWSDEFTQFGDILQVLIQPLTDTNIYSFGILDEEGFVIYAEYNIRGPFFKTVKIPMYAGTKKFIIENASIDEQFRIKLIYKE